MKKMLINAAEAANTLEQLRIVLTDDDKVSDLYLTAMGAQERKGNVYIGIITRIEPSLEAAFVNYADGRHGFLPFKEVAPSCFVNPEATSIKEALREGQKLMVQVEKEERGNKGAALTTYISLAGTYLVLMPNNPRAGGISRRIEGDDRDEMRTALSSLTLPEDMGVIIRTAGVGKSHDELQWDLGVLLKHWDVIKNEFDKQPPPFLIHKESDALIRAIRDYLRPDVSQIIIDNKEIYNKVREHVHLVRPDYLQSIKLYTDPVPLFNHYRVEAQIEAAFQREVRLRSGGAIVIDHTEALTSIDVNSGRSTRGGDIEETAYHTNLEAAEEVARQLRIRDIGGLIVIDFIDMGALRHQRAVETRLREALKMDRARVQVGRISRFGLLEMSRQRLRPSLPEFSQNRCPRCNGSGHIRGTQSLALSILRLIEEEALKINTTQVRAHLPVPVATFLLNEKRMAIHDIEQRHKVSIIMIPHATLETPHYKIERFTGHQRGTTGDTIASYQVTYPTEPQQHVPQSHATQPESHPIQHSQEKTEQPGLFKRILRGLFGHTSEPETTSTPPTTSPTASTPRQRPTHHSRSKERGEVKRPTSRSESSPTSPQSSEEDSSISSSSGRYPRRNVQSNNKSSSSNRSRLMGGRRRPGVHSTSEESPPTAEPTALVVDIQKPIVIDTTQPIVIPDMTSMPESAVPTMPIEPTIEIETPPTESSTVPTAATRSASQRPNTRRYGPRRYGHLRKRSSGEKSGAPASTTTDENQAAPASKQETTSSEVEKE